MRPNVLRGDVGIATVAMIVVLTIIPGLATAGPHRDRHADRLRDRLQTRVAAPTPLSSRLVAHRPARPLGAGTQSTRRSNRT